MRRKYKLTEEHCKKLQNAATPVPVMVLFPGHIPKSPEELVWEVATGISEELGVIHETVEPIEGTENDVTAEPNFIVESAILMEDKKIYTGKRHNHCIRKAVEDGQQPPINGVQGFIDSTKKFRTREEAAILALKTGQIKELKFSKTELYSEDLY